MAVVTGGHAYDVPNFHGLFRSLYGLEVLIQHLDDFASSPVEVRDAYDAVLFYLRFMDGPSDAGPPWYAGKPRQALSHLGETQQGIVVLHHALLAYPEYPVWQQIVGIEDRRFGYHLKQSLRVRPVVPQSPVTEGLSDWEMVDETYTMADAGEGCEILLTTDHPRSLKTLAWTRQYRRARVFCLQSGHDQLAWQNPNFREVLRRGLLWSAGRL